jgi:hypothetical protein
MSAREDAPRRLLDLERILAQSKTQTASAEDADPVMLHLGNVPADRIRRFTAELEGTRDGDDAVAAVTMRLLLNDYASAVAHLRAVARLAIGRIDAATTPIRECQKFMRREDKLDLKRAPRSTDGTATS